MSNFYFPEYDCVFIHIPKTGGLSIRRGFFDGNYKGPFFGMIPDEYSKCFKFAFVRNPFDRVISAWKMFFEFHQCTFSLEEFVNIVVDESIGYRQLQSIQDVKENIRHHTIPQTHPFNCLDKADFVGRFENLQEDFAIVCENHLGISKENAILPKMNKTKSGHYRQYYNNSIKASVAQYFNEDLTRFNYTF